MVLYRYDSERQVHEVGLIAYQLGDNLAEALWRGGMITTADYYSEWLEQDRTKGIVYDYLGRIWFFVEPYKGEE